MERRSIASSVVDRGSAHRRSWRSGAPHAWPKLFCGCRFRMEDGAVSPHPVPSPTSFHSAAPRTTPSASRAERETWAERRVAMTLGTGRRAAGVGTISVDEGLAHSAAGVGGTEGARSRDHGPLYLVTWEIIHVLGNLHDLGGSHWYPIRFQYLTPWTTALRSQLLRVRLCLIAPDLTCPIIELGAAPSLKDSLQSSSRRSHRKNASHWPDPAKGRSSLR